MRSFLNVRYVLISDYATVDHSGKLVIGGMYTEDIALESFPFFLNTLVFTILIEAPEHEVRFKFEVLSPTENALYSADGEIRLTPSMKGSRPRSIVGFQFRATTVNEPGEYSVRLTNSATSEQIEIHRFRFIQNPAPASG